MPRRHEYNDRAQVFYDGVEPVGCMSIHIYNGTSADPPGFVLNVNGRQSRYDVIDFGLSMRGLYVCGPDLQHVYPDAMAISREKFVVEFSAL